MTIEHNTRTLHDHQQELNKILADVSEECVAICAYIAEFGTHGNDPEAQVDDMMCCAVNILGKQNRLKSLIDLITEAKETQVNPQYIFRLEEVS